MEGGDGRWLDEEYKTLSERFVGEIGTDEKKSLMQGLIL